MKDFSELFEDAQQELRAADQQCQAADQKRQAVERLTNLFRLAVEAQSFLTDSEPERVKFELHKEAYEKELASLRDQIAQATQKLEKLKSAHVEENRNFAATREAHAEFLAAYEKTKQRVVGL